MLILSHLFVAVTHRPQMCYAMEIIMKKSRAKEIASSPEMVPVNYNGRAIYIEEVNPVKNAASIHYLDQPGYSQEVELTQLVETEKLY